MKADMKILHVSKKIAKNGTEYSLILALITIDGVEFIRKFAVFPSKAPQ